MNFNKQTILKFINYTKARVITAVLGCAVLYVFADRMGFRAWLTNLIWIPISFIISFGLIERFNKKE